MECYGKSIGGSSGVNADVFFISLDNKVLVVSDGASGAFDKVEASKCCTSPMVIPEIAITKCSLVEGDIIAICTDGVSDIVSSEEFSEFIQESNSLESACCNILDEVIKRCKDKHRDDITLILANYWLFVSISTSL
jgi:serine/threonine protein phosphatase PrpC